MRVAAAAWLILCGLTLARGGPLGSLQGKNVLPRCLDELEEFKVHADRLVVKCRKLVIVCYILM